MKDHIGIDYQIAGIEILLNEDCIVQRFYPLIQYKDRQQTCREKAFLPGMPVLLYRIRN